MRKLLLLMLVLAILLAIVSGCAPLNKDKTITPSPSPAVKTGKLSFTIKVPAGPSVYPNLPSKSLHSKEIPAGTSNIDIYIYNNGTSYQDWDSITVNPEVSTYNVDISAPVGSGYQVQVLARDINDICLTAGQASDLTVDEFTPNNITITLSRLQFNLTVALPATANIDDTLTITGDMTLPIDVDEDVTDSYVNSLYARYFDADNNAIILSDYTNVLTDFSNGVSRSLSFTGTAPSVTQDTVYTLYGISVLVHNNISDILYELFFEPVTFTDSTTILDGQGTIGVAIE